MEHQAPLIFLIAGEPSGDLIASRLMAALGRRSGGRVRFAGIGGPLMAEQGLESLFPYAELSMVGVMEIVPHIPRMLRRIRATARTARRLRPAAFVSIDVPEFALRVARRLSGAGFPLVHYVAPTVWAYRPGRAREIARYLDHVLCLFPFEPPYFEAEGLDASFVGHPLVEEPIESADGPGFRRRHGIGGGAAGDRGPCPAAGPASCAASSPCSARPCGNSPGASRGSACWCRRCRSTGPPSPPIPPPGARR